MEPTPTCGRCGRAITQEDERLYPCSCGGLVCGGSLCADDWENHGVCRGELLRKA